MLVAMVNVRHMRMGMRHRVVEMGMTMRFALVLAVWMRMPVMFIVDMHVLMAHRHMGMYVIVIRPE